MYIRVKVSPSAKKEILKKSDKKDNEFLISVLEPAKNNLANERVCAIIRKYFGNPRGGVKIINGHHSPIKLLKVGED